MSDSEVTKSNCLSKYDTGDAVSRFYIIENKTNPLIFIVTIQKQTEVHLVFSFDDLSRVRDLTLYKSAKEFETISTLRVYYKEGVADLSMLTKRSSYKTDYNDAVCAVQEHVQQENELATMAVSSTI